MNECITELAFRASKNYDYHPEFAKKFAELIVKECANFVENIFDDDGGHTPCEDYAKGIKKHFGVEE